jgi:FixJ family two-component response regulator
LAHKHPAVRNEKVVVVVDDDVSTLRGLKRLLRAHGYESVLFTSAEEFERNPCDGAICVVLDVHLRDEWGIAVRQRMADAGVSVPVIYMTANDTDQTRRAAVQSGCLAYLTKPFSGKSLLDPIERAAAAAV